MPEQPIEIAVLYNLSDFATASEDSFHTKFGRVWDTTILVDETTLAKWIHPATREELLTDMAKAMFMIFNDEEPTNFFVVDLDTSSAWRSMSVGDKVRVTVGEVFFEALCEESGWSIS
jgi:hypothetical protein